MFSKNFYLHEHVDNLYENKIVLIIFLVLINVLSLTINWNIFSLFTLLCLSFEPTREPSFNRHRFDHIHPLLNLQTLFALGNAGRRILRRRRRRPSFHGTLLKRLQSTAVPESFPRQKPWWLSQERSPENCKKVSNFRYPFVLSIIFFTESRLFFKWVCGVWLFIFYFDLLLFFTRGCGRYRSVGFAVVVS